MPFSGDRGPGISEERERHTFPAIQVLYLVDLVGRWKVTAEELLGPLGLHREALSDPDMRVSLPLFEQVLTRARMLTGEEGLGFYLGLQMRVSSLGHLGFAAMTSATIRDALETGARYAPTVTSALGIRLRVDGDIAAVVIEERAALGPARDMIVLWLLVGIWRMGEALTGVRLKGSVDFTFEEPAYFERFKPLLAGTARFARPVSQLLFGASQLDLPLVFHDPSAVQLALKQCERQLDELGYHQRTSSSVRRLIELEARFQSLDETARMLHVSPRTLKRKLKSEGTSYSELVDEARREKALLLIHSPRLSLEAIAERVGYADLSNFTRAFRRWTGVTPAVFRDSGRSV